MTPSASTPKTQEQQDYEVNLHAKYAPSAFKRIMECAISVPLSEGMPEGPRSKYSVGGSVGHTVSETYVRKYLNNDPFSKNFATEELPKLIRKAHPKIESSTYIKDIPEMVFHAKGYAKFIYEKVKDYLQYPHTWWLETRVTVDKERDCWGTADFLFVFEFKGNLYAVLIDYKYGEGIVVDSKDNWQLILYCLGAVKSIGTKDLKIKKVESHIYQPRVEFEAEPVTYKAKELVDEYLPRVTARIDLIEGWIKKFKTIENFPKELFEEHQRVGDWCQFCRAKTICKPYKQQHVGNTADLFKKAVASGAKKEKEFTDINALLKQGILSEEEIVFIAMNSAKIVNFVKAMPRTAMALIAKGKKLKGVKVIETSAKRAWIDDHKKLLRGLEEIGIDNPMVMVEKWISISAVEKQIGKDTKLLKGLVTKPGVNYKLVPEDHDKPAVKFGLDNLAMFRSVINKESQKGGEDTED